MRPEPKLSSRSPGESRFALVVKMRRMSAGVSFGLRSSNSATMPLTSAAATDVPVSDLIHQDVDARRRHGNVFAAIGAIAQLVVCVRRRHRDHTGAFDSSYLGVPHFALSKARPKPSSGRLMSTGFLLASCTVIFKSCPLRMAATNFSGSVRATKHPT